MASLQKREAPSLKTYTWRWGALCPTTASTNIYIYIYIYIHVLPCKEAILWLQQIFETEKSKLWDTLHFIYLFIFIIFIFIFLIFGHVWVSSFCPFSPFLFFFYFVSFWKFLSPFPWPQSSATLCSHHGLRRKIKNKK